VFVNGGTSVDIRSCDSLEGDIENPSEDEEKREAKEVVDNKEVCFRKPFSIHLPKLNFCKQSISPT
jgi:hypothetical protein